MKTRLLSTAVILPIFLLLAFSKDPVTAIAVAAFILAANYEIVKGFHTKNIKVNLYIIDAFSIVEIALAYWIFNNFVDSASTLSKVIYSSNFFGITLFMILLLFLAEGLNLVICAKKDEKTGNKRKYSVNSMVSVFIFCYITLPMLYIYTLSKFNRTFFWLIFFIAICTDSFAYLTGYFFGKTPLIPSLSPKKTVEGAIGGIAGAVIISSIFIHFYDINLGISMIYMILFIIGGSIFSQIGDLFASSLKRDLGIKDYGSLIPGHGGIMDRIDSILFTSIYISIAQNILYMIFEFIYNV